MIERRLAQVLVIFGVLNLVVIAHLVRLQVIERDYWVAQGEDNRSRRIFTPQLRGSIKLADGTVVARSEYRYDLAFTPGRFRDRWAPGALVSLLRKLETKSGFWAEQAGAIAACEKAVRAAVTAREAVDAKSQDQATDESSKKAVDAKSKKEERKKADDDVQAARDALEAIFETEVVARARILHAIVDDPERAWKRLLATPTFGIIKLVKGKSRQVPLELHLDGGTSRQLATVLGPRAYTHLAKATSDDPGRWISIEAALIENGTSPDPKRLRGLRREAEAYAALTRGLPGDADRELWRGVLRAEGNARRQLRGPGRDQAWWRESLSGLSRERRMRYRKVAGDHLARTRYPFRRLDYEAVAALDRAAFEKRLSGLRVVEQTGRQVAPIAPHLVGLTGAVPERWLADLEGDDEEEREKGKNLERIITVLPGSSAVHRSEVERRQRDIVNQVGPRSLEDDLAFKTLEDVLLGKPHAGDRNVGLSGVELWYQTRLHGRKGIRRFVHVPGRDRPIVINQVEPQNGRSVTLTLDADLQARAAKLLAEDRAKRPRNKKPIQKGGGALVALDPRTGRILVMATDPSYDRKDLKAAGDYRKFSKEKPFRLDNRALIANVPGSIFKPFTALAGLEAGVITPGAGLACWGGRAGKGPPRCAHGAHLDGATAKANRLADALCHSCNAYFAKVGKKLVVAGKKEMFQTLFHRLHLNEILIDMDGPVRGSYRGRAWLGNRIHASPANVGEARNMSIGQDPVMISPLQAAAMYGMLARGGVWRHPYLVEESRYAKVPEEQLVSRAHVRAINAGLARVTQKDGTAWGHPEARRVWRALDRIGIRVAGKTGSATRGTEAKPRPKHAWFASFAPLRDPEIVVIVFLESRGESGGFGAAPIAAAFLEHYFRDRLEAAKPRGDGR